MSDTILIHEDDIVTSQIPPAGIQIPERLFKIYDKIKSSVADRGMAGAYLAGPMFEDLKMGEMPYRACMGFHYPELAEKLGIALEAKYAPAASYSDIEDNAEIFDAVEWWAAAQEFPFTLDLSGLFYAKGAGIETPYAKISGYFADEAHIQMIDFTVSGVMPSPRTIMQLHSNRPTSAIAYDFEKAVFHFHRDTEKNLYQRNPAGFEAKPPSVMERARSLGLRVVK